MLGWQAGPSLERKLTNCGCETWSNDLPSLVAGERGGRLADTVPGLTGFIPSLKTNNPKQVFGSGMNSDALNWPSTQQTMSQCSIK